MNYGSVLTCLTSGLSLASLPFSVFRPHSLRYKHFYEVYFVDIDDMKVCVNDIDYWLRIINPGFELIENDPDIINIKPLWQCLIKYLTFLQVIVAALLSKRHYPSFRLNKKRTKNAQNEWLEKPRQRKKPLLQVNPQDHLENVKRLCNRYMKHFKRNCSCGDFRTYNWSGVIAIGLVMFVNILLKGYFLCVKCSFMIYSKQMKFGAVSITH